MLLDGFFIWDKPGHPTKGWAFREGGASVGGPIDDEPCETELQMHERWDAGTELAHWFGGPLPGFWRRASADEVGKLTSCQEVRRAMDCFL